MKASRLNDDLRDAEVYNALQHWSVQASLDIRNAAAHAKYDEYDHAQVAVLIQNVGDFMVRHPAWPGIYAARRCSGRSSATVMIKRTVMSVGGMATVSRNLWQCGQASWINSLRILGSK